MRILICNYEYPPVGGGAANASQAMAQTWALQGHQVSVLTTGISDFHGVRDENGVTVLRCHTGRRRYDQCTPSEMARFVYHARREGHQFIQDQSPDILVCFFSIPTGMAAAYLAKQHNIPYVVSLRGGDVPKFEPRVRWQHLLLTYWRRRILNGAKHVVANSPYLKALSEKADPYVVNLVPNGVDALTYTPSGERTAGNRVLYVGRMVEQKNLQFILDVLKSVYAQKPRLQVDMVGDGPLQAQLVYRSKSLGLENVVHWHGWQSKADLHKFYHAADIVINPSLYEGLPNAVMEGMAAGLAPVLSDIPGHAWLSEENSGITLPVDHDVWVSAIVSLIEDENRRTELQQRARHRMKSHFSWESVCDQYMALMT